MFLETIKNQFKDREANAGNINNELDANNKDQVDKLPLVYNTEENDLAEAPDRSGEQIERATNPKNESPQKEKKNEESPVKNSKADMDQDNSKLSPKNKSLPTDQEETRNSGSGPGRPRGAKSKTAKPQQVQGSTLERFFLIKGTSDQNNHSTLESTSTIRNEKENDKLAANFEQAAVQSNPEEQN